LAEDGRTAALLAALEAAGEPRCAGCGRATCGHELVMSTALGHKDAPRCARCLAASVGRDKGPFVAHVFEYIRRQDCYREGWRWASRQEGFRDDGIPPCVGEETVKHDAEWDAGDLSCGDLVLELRQRLRAMAAGQVLRLRAADPGAPQDLPAWCGLTGHTLLEARHPLYWIRRKTED
jgi:tRNA 2-thiouridine synthesizing protein A